MMNTMTGCKDCLCHLKICKAECCRQHVIKILKDAVIMKNKKYEVETPLTEDQKHYYRLHKCEITSKGFIFTARNYKIEEDKITVFENCIALNQNMTCKLHGKPTQPRVCRSPNKEGDSLNGIANVTPNCLFKELYKEE